jgi:hypothetical protein
LWREAPQMRPNAEQRPYSADLRLFSRNRNSEDAQGYKNLVFIVKKTPKSDFYLDDSPKLR